MKCRLPEDRGKKKKRNGMLKSRFDEDACGLCQRRSAGGTPWRRPDCRVKGVLEKKQRKEDKRDRGRSGQRKKS